MDHKKSYRGLLDHKLWDRLKYIPKDVIWDIALAGIFANLLIAALPIFTRIIYDRVIPNFAVDTLWVLSTGILLVVIFDFLFKASRSWIIQNSASKASAYIDTYAIKSLFQQKSGKDFAKVTYYLGLAHEVSQFYCTKLLPTVIDLFFVFFFFGVVYSLSPAMMMVPLTCGLVIIAMQFVLITRLNHITAAHQVNQRQRNHNLIGIINGFSTIKHLNVFKIFNKKWRNTSHQYAQHNFNVYFATAFSNLTIQSIMMLNTIFIMIVGVYQINVNQLSIGALIAISILSSRILAPLVNIGDIIAKLPKMIHQKGDIEKFIGQDEISDTRQVKHSFKGSMLVKDISFSLEDRPILHDCSLYIEAKEKIALVGASGAGKTTLLKNLSMEYAPSKGVLFFDHYNAMHLDETFAKNQISVVEQYPYFFEGTLRENLSIGQKISDDKLINMLEQLDLYKNIAASGLGLDLPIVEGGKNLSGGQKQALSVIRAVIRSPKILLMDEPTSMMDHQLEQKVIAFLKQYLPEVTMIVTSHRTSILALVDRIVVMQEGKIIKDGLRYDILKQLEKAKP